MARSMLRLLTPLVFVAVAACGGGGDDPKTVFDDPAPAASVTSNTTIPIRRIYTEAGTYELTLSGTFTPTNFTGPDQLSAVVSFGGQGTIVAGKSDSAYGITASAPVALNQSVTINMAGPGPWQIDVLSHTGNTAGVANLNLHSVLR